MLRTQAAALGKGKSSPQRRSAEENKGKRAALTTKDAAPGRSRRTGVRRHKKLQVVFFGVVAEGAIGDVEEIGGARAYAIGHFEGFG